MVSDFKICDHEIHDFGVLQANLPKGHFEQRWQRASVNIDFKTGLNS